jgi:outer membrane protein OmpA-like peptidoglycan-associated protein
MKNLVDMAQEALEGGTVGRMSSMLHESESGTRRAFDRAVPASISGLASQAATEDGARSLLDTFKGGRYPTVEPKDLGRTVADPAAAGRVVSSSEGLVNGLFGDRLGGIVDGISGDAGVSRSSASKLLGLAAPLVMGLVGKQAVSRNLDARGLSNYLGEQDRLASGTRPARAAAAYGMTPAYAGAPAGGGTVTGAPRMVEIPHSQVTGGRRSLLPWVVAGLAVLAGLLWLMNRRGDRDQVGERPAVTAPADTERAAKAPPAPAQPTPAQPTPAQPTPAQPAPGQAPVAQISAGEGMAGLSRALEGEGAMPARFVVSGLAFRQGSAQIDPATGRVLDDVAAALNAHPSASIRVEDHTDSAGDAQANVALSQERADAVKSYLAAQGVAAERIEATGLGSEQPLASNDSEQGRAQNGRTEIVLTQR